MSQKTILVIDDSATIRRLVDNTLSPEGYRVILAPNAEEGLEQARTVKPDMILLDHQLPGTTGFDVCEQLLTIPEVQHTPVVVSSTLRKKAYVEYADSPNVVDMLPKPYTEDLLITTVENALDTGSLIVQSQADGTAVPEVINALEEADFAGTFNSFSLREVLDFVNNSTKSGVLEVQAGAARIWFYVDEGRIQAVTGTGIDSKEIAQSLPASLRDIAPVLNLTVGGKLCSEVDGLVELLDRKVLDPRLLRQVLRHQAAMLVWKCFHSELKGFRFETGRMPSPLFRKLPLDSSLAALTVEAAVHCPAHELAEENSSTHYSRRAIRGQNLDRAGLSAQHLKVLNGVSEPITAANLATQLGMDPDETRRVLQGLSRADLIDRKSVGQVPQVVVLEGNADWARSLRLGAQQYSEQFNLKIVRDQLAVRLLLKRSRPDVLILPLEADGEITFAAQAQQELAAKDADVRIVGVLSSTDDRDTPRHTPVACDAYLTRHYSAEQCLKAVEQAMSDEPVTQVAESHESPSLATCAS
ncbi:MAG: response regulator [Planctomycetaceae bacterium]|nr:response regulator [Planctomycetaceae bacterium]